MTPFAKKIRKITDPDIFKKELFAANIVFDDFRYIGAYIPKKLLCDQDFNSRYGRLINRAIPQQLKKLLKPKYWRRIGTEIPNAIRSNEEFLTNQTKKEIIDITMKNKKIFHLYSFSNIIDFAIKWAPSEKEKIDLINKYFKNISSQYLQEIIKDIPIAELDKNIQLKIISNPTKLLKKFKKIDWDKNIRAEFIKEVAKSKTFMKMVDFDITITKEDLSKLPPMMRFHFIKILFEHKINLVKSDLHTPLNYFNDWRLKQIKWAKYIKIAPLSADDMKELLLVPAFHKNQMVQNFIDGYLKYFEKRENIVEDFSIIYNYLQ